MAPEPTNVRDVVSPQMFYAVQIFGYALFAFIGIFLSFATRQAILDARQLLAKFKARTSTPKVAMPPVESPVRAMPARVLAFAPVRTRNRVVVR